MAAFLLDIGVCAVREIKDLWALVAHPNLLSGVEDVF